jgi:hypothetical protein
MYRRREEENIKRNKRSLSRYLLVRKKRIDVMMERS